MLNCTDFPFVPKVGVDVPGWLVLGYVTTAGHPLGFSGIFFQITIPAHRFANICWAAWVIFFPSVGKLMGSVFCFFMFSDANSPGVRFVFSAV